MCCTYEYVREITVLQYVYVDRECMKNGKIEKERERAGTCERKRVKEKAREP